MTTLTTSSAQSYRWTDPSLAAFTVAVLLVTIAYFAAVDGWQILRGVLSWNILGAIVLALVPVFLWIFWSHRERHIELDYHMLYLPLLTWLVVSIIYKVVMWRLTRGEAIWLTYGWDKGLQNFLAEPAIVIVVSGLYLLRFATTDGRGWAIRLAVMTLIASALVAIVFPPLGE